MTGAVMCQQRGFGEYGEAIGFVGGCVDADQRNVLRIEGGRPRRAVERQQGVLGRGPDQPARARPAEGPRAVLEGGDLAFVAGKFRRRRIAHHPAVPLGWIGGGRIQPDPSDTDMQQGVEHAQRLVVGDMLLCLRRHGIGEVEKWSGFRHRGA